MINLRKVPKQNSILLIDSNKEQCKEMCDLLARENYLAKPLSGIADLEGMKSEDNPLVVIIDIDTVDIDNCGIQDLNVKYPGITIFSVSKNRFHPELQNAICYNIYACLNRPINSDELFYFLKSLDGQIDRQTVRGDPDKGFSAE